MALVVAKKDQNGNSGCIMGKHCHPSGVSCLASAASIELCLDLVASTYTTGGFELTTDPVIIACPGAADCLLGPCDPYGVPYDPPPNITLKLSIPEGEDDPKLMMYVDGEEAPDGFSAPEGTNCVWVRFYGYH